MAIHHSASRSHVGLVSDARHRDATVLDPWVGGRIAPVAGATRLVVDLITSLNDRFRAFVEAVDQDIDRRRLLADLAQRDDRMLADMGLDRTMIGAVAAGRLKRPANPANGNAVPPLAA